MPITYRIVQVRPNGTERVIRDVVVNGGLTEEQQIRLQAFTDARLEQLTQHIRVYSSQDDGTFLPGRGDCIWDSDFNN